MRLRIIKDSLSFWWADSVPVMMSDVLPRSLNIVAEAWLFEKKNCKLIELKIITHTDFVYLACLQIKRFSSPSLLLYPWAEH